MKIATTQLIGAALDWAVCATENLLQPAGIDAREFLLMRACDDPALFPSTDWEYGGPIIEREKIELYYSHDKKFWKGLLNTTGMDGIVDLKFSIQGPTALIAAMRCYVASKLGDEVDVPDELLT